MPENGFSPRESAPRRLERSSSLTPRGLYPDFLSSPRVWGLRVTGRFLRLPAGVSRASTGFDRGSVVGGKEQLGRRLAGERRGAPREPAEALAVEADDRLGDDAVAADAEERRNVRRRRGRPRPSRGSGRRPSRDASRDGRRRLGISPDHPAQSPRPRGQASPLHGVVRDAPNALEVGPGELAGGTRRLEDRVERFAVRRSRGRAGFVPERDRRERRSGIESGHGPRL